MRFSARVSAERRRWRGSTLRGARSTYSIWKPPPGAHGWGTHAGAELDLLLIRNGRRYGVEFKAGDAPQMTKSLHIALEDLSLERAWIVYPGAESN